VIAIKSGIVMKRNSFFGNSSISSVLDEPVIVPLNADIIVSSAIPIRYIMQAVMKLIARNSPVANRQI
jgi:hypothetical protein